MKIGGFVPFTLSDFPGCIAAMVFTVGCNFDCAYCHNRGLIDATDGGSNHRSAPTDGRAIVAYLQKHRRFLDGLVVSGGEPTCQPMLTSFVRAVKRCGIKVKLDTNGSHPEVLAALLNEKLVDYVAMDIKAPWSRYESVANRSVDVDAIRASVALLRHHCAAFEFRVTAVSPWLSADDLLEIGHNIGGMGPVYLQKFQPPHFQLPQRMDTTAGIDEVCMKLQRQFDAVYIR